MLVLDEIKDKLRDKKLGRNVRLYEQVDSTNEVAQKLAQEGAGEGTLVIANEQTQGRGRLGRSWMSAKNVGLYFSLILRPDLKPDLAPVLNLAAGVAVTRAIEKECGVATDLKWPNDVLVNGRKCSGILMEMNGDVEAIKFLVLGIGINVNHQEFPRELQARASSLWLEAGRAFSRTDILVAVLEELETVYRQWVERGSEPIVEQWIERSSFAWGRKLSVELGDRRLEGTTCGLTPQGALRLELSNGGLAEIMSGDVVAWE